MTNETKIASLKCKLGPKFFSFLVTFGFDACYDIKPVRKEEGKSYWKIPLCDDDATREQEIS